MIGTLTSSISHEFNNLLSPIMGYSLMALEKLPESDSALYDDILEIYNTSVKAKTLVQRLSDLSRKHSESVFRPLDPDELVRKVMSVAKPAKPEEVEVRLELACAGIRMDGNELQLSQILLNLVLNAFDAMKERGGTLTLSTSSDGENVLFRVSDTGPGIRPEVIPHIFEPFFTTKSEGYGTGLPGRRTAGRLLRHPGPCLPASGGRPGNLDARSSRRGGQRQDGPCGPHQSGRQRRCRRRRTWLRQL